jgi:hypothetical protein
VDAAEVPFSLLQFMDEAFGGAIASKGEEGRRVVVEERWSVRRSG